MQTAGLLYTVTFLGQVVPDMTWTPKRVIKLDARFVVHGTARGAPVRPLPGADPADDTAFKTSSIDFVTVNEGAIKHDDQIEYWVREITQITTN